MTHTPMEATDFRDMTETMERVVSERGSIARLTIQGFDVEGMEIVIACAGEEGVVLSLGDTRVSLSLTQMKVLRALFEAFGT